MHCRICVDFLFTVSLLMEDIFQRWFGNDHVCNFDIRLLMRQMLSLRSNVCFCYAEVRLLLNW
jgi:hypothetical protein